MKILETVSLSLYPSPTHTCTHTHAFGAQKMVAIGCGVAHRARITPITIAQTTFCAGGDVLLRTDNGQVTEGGIHCGGCRAGGGGYRRCTLRHIWLGLKSTFVWRHAGIINLCVPVSVKLTGLHSALTCGIVGGGAGGAERRWRPFN